MVATPVVFRVPENARSWTPTPDRVDAMVRRIAERVHPLRILLFGSVARDEVAPDSDIDLLVIVEDGSDVPALEQQAYLAAGGLGVGKDIVVTTPARIERECERVLSVVRWAINEGITVYERS